MNKGKKKEAKKEEQQQKQSGVRSYFTKEINDQMVEMSSKEMENIMKGMIGSREWIAIIKYISIRTVLLDSQLRTTNPNSDAHTISWSQGALAGICDIENYIIELNSEEEEKEEGVNTNTSPEGKV